MDLFVDLASKSVGDPAVDLLPTRRDQADGLGSTLLLDRLATKRAHVGIIGLGYAGLPMAVEIARAGFSVIGFDIDPSKVASIDAGRSPVSDVPDGAIAALQRSGRLSATGDLAYLRVVDVAIICVPTPLTTDRRPDLRFVEAAADSLAEHLHPGMLVVLQSTCAPGTTRTVLLPRLAAGGLDVGRDFHLAFAPERIDPGNARFDVRNTPKLVGGITESCTGAACALFRQIVERVVPVSSPDVAEMAKLMENTFRFINISFANEMALLCDRLGIDTWEVIDAAATKPFAFLPHYPSAGVGGHCIPVVPFYLEALARAHGVEAQLIQASARINDAMPGMIVDKIRQALAERDRRLSGAKVLLLGITYKPNIADIRESAAVRILGELARAGAQVGYHDPLVSSVTVEGRLFQSQALAPAMLQSHDVVVILTPHAGIDYRAVVEHAPLVVDTRGGGSAPATPNVLNVWRPPTLGRV